MNADGMMTPKRGTSQVVEDHGTVKKAKYAHFLLPILRGIALVVAIWAFIPYILVLLYGGESGISVPIFAVASMALMAMTPLREPPPGLAGDRSVTPFWHQLPWSQVTFCIITGMGVNWVCAFRWFSGRYAVFSAPVVGAMGLILVFYAVIGLLTAWLTGGNWRKALLAFALAPCALGGIAQRFLR